MMLNCCKIYKSYKHNIYNNNIKKDYIYQARCIYDCEKCIKDNDIIIRVSKEYTLLCNDLIKYISGYMVEDPNVKIVKNDDLMNIEIVTIQYYYDTIIRFFESEVECSINSDNYLCKVNFNNIKISIIKTLCRTHSNIRNKYSDDILIGKIISLCDILKESKFLEVFLYPQIQPVIRGDLKKIYHYGFLHDLAIYIEKHYNKINWSYILSILYQVEVNQHFLFLFTLFNDLYNLIPINTYDNFKLQEDRLPLEDIFLCMQKVCTTNEIINNDFRNLYSHLLTDLNITQREYYYSTYAEALSLDKNRIEFKFNQKQHDNPYGTAVFHGSEEDFSDELSLEWGLWSTSSELSFILKIHNKFITPNNSELKLENCRVEIPIAAADKNSHKYTEIFIRPYFSESNELMFNITDEMEYDQGLKNYLKYQYEIVNEDIIMTLAINKSYLHIPDDGSFGMDILISCADSNSFYSGYDFRKTLTWTGRESSWRDIRTYALMKPKTNN